jgi:hypothetical protein
MNKKLARFSLILVLLALLIAALACEQAGEIIPDAEATQRAIPSVTPTQDIQDVENADFEEGDTVAFIGKGYLIPFYANPGDTVVLSHAARGDEGTVSRAVLFEGEIWYEVESVAGTGWITAEFLEKVE